MLPEEEQIRDVERMLDAGAARRDVGAHQEPGAVGQRTSRDDRARAAIALWLCACLDDDISPTWLIYGDDDDLTWCSLPAGLDVDDIVSADLVAGSHTSTCEVLEWLSGALPLPGDYSGDPSIAGRVSKALCTARS